MVSVPLLALLCACGADNAATAQSTAAAEATEAVTADSAKAATEAAASEDVPEGASPLVDGEYEIAVESSSSMFNIVACTLIVENGNMEALMTMSGSGYRYVYPGTPEEAESADPSTYIETGESDQGTNLFRFPVAALDEEIPCAAFSKKKEQWYDRMLVFRSDTLPASAFADGSVPDAASLALADGTYRIDVTLEGGTGRASVESPCRLFVEDGKASAEIIWSSANYDYMKVDDVRYDAEIRDDRSVCVIPVAYFSRPLAVIADTTAMSTPHEIEYTLLFDAETVVPEDDAKGEPDGGGVVSLRYADRFTVEQTTEGNTLITVAEEGSILLVAEGNPEPAETDALVLRANADNIYLADSAAMDLFLALDALPLVRMTGTQEGDWSLPEVRERMASGDLLYAGKYSAPDYELLLEEGCALAVENTMIHHTPEVKEQLEELGIPVIVTRASYETHPLGRLEWIKFYGLLTGRANEACAFFDRQEARVNALPRQTDTGKTVAFFYISTNGYVNVRKAGDYVPKMIELAGGRYIFSDTEEDEDDGRATMNMQQEAFFAGARDADILIYNATVDGGVSSLDALLDKAPWLADFKAVREGNVWCTDLNLYQQTSCVADMITDLGAVIADRETGSGRLSFLYRLH